MNDLVRCAIESLWVIPIATVFLLILGDCIDTLIWLHIEEKETEKRRKRKHKKTTSRRMQF